ncbi:MAG: glycoside hydrolase family 16 protein, partial [Jatrophihabitans sp.]
YDDPSHVWVRGGYLNLAVTKLVDPAPCATPLGPLTPAYGGAVIHTKGTFSQTGGLFEARIKFGGGVGLHDDFWLWPENDYANYPGHAEIDIAEPYGAIPNSVPGATHVTNAAGADGGTVNWCSVPDWSGSFHTYGVSWSGGGTITFSVDGTTCFSFTNQSALAGYPPTAPFDQPFFMILQTLVDDGAFSPAPNASTVFPAVTQVDWVRVWK